MTHSISPEQALRWLEELARHHFQGHPDDSIHLQAVEVLRGLEEQLEAAQREAERSEQYAEDRDLIAQKFEEDLALLQQAVQNYIKADTRYQRRIDTAELRDALESSEQGSA